MHIEERLRELGITLPTGSSPVANYVAAKRVGDLLYLSGKGPRGADGKFLTGKVGDTVSVEEAYQRARLTGIELIAAMHAALGDLDRVVGIVKVLGMVNAVPSFTEHPKVINGCSDLFVEVFGETGRHARSAIGVGSLPAQISVEIEALVLVR